MTPTCAIPLPLGYDIWSMDWLYHNNLGAKEIQVLWTCPNGRPIFVRSVADKEMLQSDEFWQTMLQHVQEYYIRGKAPNNPTAIGELNERVSTVIDHTPTAEQGSAGVDGNHS